MSSASDELSFLREVVGPGPGDKTLAAAWRQSCGDLAAAVNIVLDVSPQRSRPWRLQAPHEAKASGAITLVDDSDSGQPCSSTARPRSSGLQSECPPNKKAKLTDGPKHNFKQSLNSAPKSSITIGCDWGFQVGVLLVQGYATTRLHFQSTTQTNARPLLSRRARLELRWNAEVRRPRGRPGGLDALADREGGSIRFSSQDVEIGKLPANTARTLVPLLSRQLISLECMIGDDPPIELEPGTSIPLLLKVSLRSSVLACPSKMTGFPSASSKIDAKAGYKAVVKAEVSNEVQRSAIARLLDLLRLPLLRSALDLLDTSNMVDDTFSMAAQSAMKEESDIEEAPGSAEMSSEAASNLGGREVLERSGLPMVALPESIFRSRLRTYQAQAVWWMWQRENPAASLPDGWIEVLEGETASVQALAKTTTKVHSEGEQQDLHPMWDEYELPGHISNLPGQRKGPLHYLYHHRSSGALSLDFPHASLAHCRGGILADDMGLGKTVMCLALFSLDHARLDKSNLQLEHPHSSAKQSEDSLASNGNDSKVAHIGGVLVLAPVSLISQWKSEIEAHFPQNRCPSVHEYHGGGRRHSADQLQGFNIVLTTYGTLSSEREDGPLFQIHWQRVVLDEAHTIKNRCSRVSQAACRIRSSCRWCVTGTPLQNSVDELFPLVKFLHIDPWSNWAAWRKAISIPLENGRHGDEKSLPVALDTVRRIIQPLLLRRTKSTRNPLNGELLLKLPLKRVHILEIEPSPAERDFYEALYAKAKAKFNTFVAEGEALNMYTHIFALIVKLRQALCHPFLVFARNGAVDSDMDALEQRCLRTMVANGCDNDGSTESFVTNLLDDVRNGRLADCPICVDSPEDPTMTICGHIFCRECALKAFHAWSGACPVCRREGALEKKSLKVLPGASRFPAHLLKAANGADQEIESQGDKMYSTKMKELLRRLRIDISSGCRAVVFSQWTSFLDLIGPALESAAIPWQRFDGSLSIEERRRRVAWLGETAPEGAGGRVLLCSLKAGGVGLNLVAANRLYLLDLWWNPAVEEQAIQRVHRIGQTSEVHVYKFVVGDSIDSDLLELQRAKAHLLENAIQGRSHLDTASKLTLDDLKCLFSPCRSIGAPRERGRGANDSCVTRDVSWIRVPADSRN